MRRPLIAGNWKMNGARPEARALLADLLPRLTNLNDVEVVICPPFTALETVGGLLKGSGVALGAQDMFWKDRGAYTGQISPPMLLDLGVEYIIIGHSEPRGRFGTPEPDFDADILAYFGDTNESINRKLRAALTAGLRPILCVGETLMEREQSNTVDVIERQLYAALHGIPVEQAMGLTCAYEPVWAIGTGKVCEPDEAERVCHLIRSSLKLLYNAEVAETARIQYGGSVKPDNAAILLSQPNIDGALVGGASLKAADFAAIIAAASLPGVENTRQ